MKYFLAVDIGASSGRHMLAHMEEDRMVLEEVHRFYNGMTEKNGHKIWDVDTLFEEIKIGMKKCASLGKIPEEKLYAATGIQKQPFNTIYQLMALRKNAQEELDKADKLLMIPDYFHYLLTGKLVQEYTNATTTQLVDPVTKDWNRELIRRLDYPEHIFQKIELPGHEIGMLRKVISEEVGFNCKVILPATHDTGAAVMAVPTVNEHPLYISSGTWSLMGTELTEADCSKESEELNLTNEGGYDYRFRYLKNIMGLWMIQSVKKEVAENQGSRFLMGLQRWHPLSITALPNAMQRQSKKSSQ